MDGLVQALGYAIRAAIAAYEAASRSEVSDADVRAALAELAARPPRKADLGELWEAERERQS